MPAPACPDWTRRSQAAAGEGNVPSALEISRVARLPIWWHPVHPSVLTMFRIHSPWLFTFVEIPFPPGPVPGNSLLAGTCSSASQYCAG